jgi:hypothetical protein
VSRETRRPRPRAAAVQATAGGQTGPCHGRGAVVWVGKTNGPGGRIDLLTCACCAATWTTTREEATR